MRREGGKRAWAAYVGPDRGGVVDGETPGGEGGCIIGNGLAVKKKRMGE